MTTDTKPRLDYLERTAEAMDVFVRDIDNAWQLMCKWTEQKGKRQERAELEQLIYTAAARVGNADAALKDLLTPYHQLMYDSTQRTYGDLEEQRQQAVSVLEWLVLPENAVEDQVDESRIDLVTGFGRFTAGKREKISFDQIKDGTTTKGWKEFWKRTPYTWCSLFELYQAGRSLKDILVDRPGMYSSEEKARSEAMLQRVRDYITSNGIVLGTTVAFSKDSLSAIVDTESSHVSPHFISVIPDVSNSVPISTFLEHPETGYFLRSSLELPLARPEDVPDQDRQVGETFAFLSGVKRNMMTCYVPSYELRKGVTSSFQLQANQDTGIAALAPSVPTFGKFVKIQTLGVDRNKYQELPYG